MKSQIIEKLLESKDDSLKEIINTVKNNKSFQRIFNDIKEQYFVEDSVHGLSHNERVLLMACYIGIQEGLSGNELDNLLYAALYHDIGRKVIPNGTKGIGVRHGYESANIIDQNSDDILPNKSESDKQIIKALCMAHSVEDNKIATILNKNNIVADNRIYKLIDILKDADALDRVRLPHGKLDVTYLRTNTSIDMVETAKSIFKEYKKTEKKLHTEEMMSENQLRDKLLDYGENYYLIRSLNKRDIENLKNSDGIYPNNYTDELYTTKDVLEHSSVARNSTSKFISMSADPNVVLTYNKENLHKFVLIKLSKDEIMNSKKYFSSGDYLLNEMENQIEKYLENSPENVKQIIQSVESAKSISEIRKIINAAERNINTSLIDSQQQYLNSKEQLNHAKKIAKCKVLNYYGIMENVEENLEKMGSIEKYTGTMRVSYHNSEWLCSGKIETEKIINISSFFMQSLALLKQAEFQKKDKKQLELLEKEILKLVISESKIDFADYQKEEFKQDLTIDKAYEITNGEISYRDTNNKYPPA